MTIKNLDHLVLTTADLEACVHFYRDILGMRYEVTAHGQHALFFGEQKINLHTRPGEFQPAARHPVTGSQDFCLIVEEDIAGVKREIEEKGWPILEGVVSRIGAKGDMQSIYMYDPDGNLVELAEYC